jgi:molybdopterin-binding protein
MVREKLVTPREAAHILGVSYPTVKQWIYKKKLQTIKTAGGHHRVPESQLDRFLHLAFQRGEISQRRASFRRISGRNQLVGRLIGIKIDGLIAQVNVLIGGQRITAIVTADAVREMRLKIGETIAALINPQK